MARKKQPEEDATDSPDDGTSVPHVARWQDVLDHDIHTLRSWLGEEVMRRCLGRRFSIDAAGVMPSGQTPTLRVWIDGRRGPECGTTAIRLVGGMLRDLPMPFEGTLDVLLSVEGSPEVSNWQQLLRVGALDRLRRASSVRELERRLSWHSEVNRELRQVNTHLSLGAPALLHASAQVIKAMGGATSGPVPPPTAASMHPVVEATLEVAKGVFQRFSKRAPPDRPTPPVPSDFDAWGCTWEPPQPSSEDVDPGDPTATAGDAFIEDTTDMLSPLWDPFESSGSDDGG